MARVVRGEQFRPEEVSVMHCISRCVRQCFLCGKDEKTGKDYGYRKQWIEERIGLLAGVFAIDVLGFSVMSNHLHVILRNRPDVMETWSDREVALRWWKLHPQRFEKERVAKDRVGAEPTEADLEMITSSPERVAEIRRRLCDISWFVRSLAEPIARRANDEDRCSGRFWSGRFKSTKLCDEAAILVCSAYVDLNPIRAGIAATPEASEHTSARRRIMAAKVRDGKETPASDNDDSWLAPLELNERELPGPQPSVSGRRASDKGFLPLTLPQYLELLDWTGRQKVEGKRGVVPETLAPILERLGISQAAWLDLSLKFGKLFYLLAGCPESTKRENARPRSVRFRVPPATIWTRGAPQRC